MRVQVTEDACTSRRHGPTNYPCPAPSDAHFISYPLKHHRPMHSDENAWQKFLSDGQFNATRLPIASKRCALKM
jgi:hypothetical protein